MEINLNEKQYDILNSYIQDTSKQLSLRALNIFNSLKKHGIETLLEFVYGSLNIKSYRNVGTKTERELLSYFEQIKDFIAKEIKDTD